MTRIMTQIIGKDGVSRKKKRVKVLNDLVAGGYKYRTDKIFYTREWLFGLLPVELKIPTLMYNEDEFEPVDVHGDNDFGRRTLMTTAEEFGLIVEDAAFAMNELLRGKTTVESLMFPLLCVVLGLQVIMFLAMVG